ncbi:MAG TPA: hypothetical protein VFH72_10590 [Candidatus Baltobacteraceae bacterium]|jgi:hypothetical protein|nr:hypothetical protein [Candidatus Baltobacteraceae bacterium]
MTTIKESLHLACPYVRAREYLRESLENPAQSGMPQTLRLTGSLPGTNIELEKGVRVTYAHGSDPMHFDQPWTVRWTPESGGLYPAFSGMLTVRADEDYTASILELEGEYAPPMGTTGRLFDKALGRRIAGETMQTLLHRIGNEMMTRYRTEDAAKGAGRR